MDTPPPLPDSDDPFELLGLERDCSERDLKRAYARLIRVYRPDRDPAEFRRVREAFEAAQGWLADGPIDGPIGEDGDWEEPEWPLHATGSDERALELSDVLLDGDIEQAFIRLEQQREDDPESERPYALRFLLAEASGESFEAASSNLHDGLLRGAPIAAWIADVLSTEESGQFVLGAGCQWPILQLQPERDVAVMLFEERCHVLLLAGEEEQVSRELGGPEFRLAAARHEGLRMFGLRVACALAWSRPEEAEDLHSYYFSDPEDEDWIEEGYLDRVRLRPAWQRWVRESGAPEPLTSYLRLCHTVPDPDLKLLGTSLPSLGQTLSAFDRMHGIDENLSYFTALAFEVADEMGDDDDEEERPLTRRQESALFRFRDTTEKLLDKSWQNRVLEIGIVAAMIGLFVVFRSLGFWAGVLAAVIGFVALGYAVVSTDERMYRRFVRSRILPLVAEHGVAPERVVAWLKKNTKGSESLNRLDDEITDDVPLQLLYRLQRFFARMRR